jgi:uncharacterized metal-binding protein YceD (DUF177 family)
MDIDLKLLHSKTVDKIDITNKYDIPDQYIDKNLVLSLKNIQVDGKIYIGSDDEDRIDCTINGNMILEDSISLEPIEYPFSIKYDDILEENSKKNENTLDIFSFLWENIVLEVPLQFTKVKDLSKFHGDGWKLISEDEITNSNNPFGDLLKDFKEE